MGKVKVNYVKVKIYVNITENIRRRSKVKVNETITTNDVAMSKVKVTITTIVNDMSRPKVITYIANICTKNNMLKISVTVKGKVDTTTTANGLTIKGQGH